MSTNALQPTNPTPETPSAVIPAPHFNLRKLPISSGTSSGLGNIVSMLSVEMGWLMVLAASAIGLGQLVAIEPITASITLALWITSVGCAFYLLGLYRIVTAPAALEVRHMVLTLAGTSLIIGLAQAPYVAANWFNYLPLAGTALLACITLPFVRMLSRRYFSRFSWWGRRVLFVGGDARSAAILGKLIAMPHSGLRPIGVLEEEADLDESIPREAYYGPPEKLAAVSEQLGVSQVVFVPRDANSYSLLELFHASESNVNSWMVVPPTDHIPALWTESFDLFGETALGWNNLLESLSHRLMKRLFDLAIILMLMPILLPLIGVISLAIKLTCGGAIFFSQERVGRRNTRFRCHKFRTMHANGDEILKAYLEAHPELQAEWNRNFKLKNDPRVTWIGRILRKTSLDELPQLFNVLWGEMSLVGPRPLLASELNRYGDAFASYVQMKPGITGLWQISGRSDTTFADRAWFDEYYVRNWSPWLDIYILGCTLKVVARCEGAY